jgi:hypothetical protein
MRRSILDWGGEGEKQAGRVIPVQVVLRRDRARELLRHTGVWISPQPFRPGTASSPSWDNMMRKTAKWRHMRKAAPKDGVAVEADSDCRGVLLEMDVEPERRCRSDALRSSHLTLYVQVGIFRIRSSQVNGRRSEGQGVVRTTRIAGAAIRL